MEKEILEILKQMQSELTSLKKGQEETNLRLSGLETKVDNIESDVKVIKTMMDSVYDQTADLTEFRTVVIEKLDDLKEVEKVTRVNCYDIAKLKSIK
ncbi:MAG: hypothetical protein ACRC7N_21115 [Clostridium sp.]